MKAPNLAGAARVVLAGSYVALIAGPAYLAGGAAGEDITPERVGAYAGAIGVSVLVGLSVNRVWMYALPWVVWAVWTWIETGLRVFTDQRLFEPADAPIGIGMLAVGESLALWAGAWFGDRFRGVVRARRARR